MSRKIAPKKMSMYLSIYGQGSSLFQNEATTECQQQSEQMKQIQTIEYLSKEVRYDTAGRDLFTTLETK
jgi:hypothetical protein